MEITDIKVFLANAQDEDRLRAYVTIVLDACFVVRDIKVIAGGEGLFVAMPAKRRKDGTYRDIAHPLNAPTRAWLEEAVLAEYDRELERGGRSAVAAQRPPGSGGGDGNGSNG